MKKLKIAFAHRGLTYGGVERWMLEICQNVRNCQVSAVALEGVYFEPKVAKEFFLSRTKIYAPCEMMKGCTRTSSPKEALALACKNADILVVVAGFQNLKNEVWGLDLPIVLVSHGQKNMLRDVKEALPAAHYLATVAQVGLESFPEHLRDTVAVIPNGIDPGRIIPSASKEELKKRLGIPDWQKIVCQIARHGREKNPRAIIQALTALPQEWLGISVGAGPLTDQLLDEAKAYVPGRLIFADPDTPIADILAVSDVCMLASDAECFPLVFLESWFGRVPVVASALPIVKEVNETFGTEMIKEVPLRPSPFELSQAISIPRDENQLDIIKQIANRACDSRITVPIWEQFFGKVMEDWMLPSSTRHFAMAERVTEAEVRATW